MCLAGLPALAQPRSAGAPDPKLIEDLVAANRMLADLGVVDGFGHVSVRHDKDPNRYLMSRSMAPALVTAEDILEFDLDSTPSMPTGRAVFLERFIHGEIYKARPDVKAVVHSHSPSVIPFGVVKVPLQADLPHAALHGRRRAGVRDPRRRRPGSDLLVRDAALGTALAKRSATRRWC